MANRPATPDSALPPDWQLVTCPLCGSSRHQPERTIRNVALVRCSSCHMVFANPQPREDLLGAGYDGQGNLAYDVGGHLDKIRFYESWFSPEDLARWTRHLHRMAKLIGGPGHLLEYGCGPALVGKVASGLGWRVEAIDVGSWIRELQPARSFPLHVGTLRDQQWPAGCFDAVYAQDVLEHLSRPREELTEIVRLLRPGGALFVHVPNYASLTIRLGRSRFAYNEPPSHLNYFTPSTLTNLLRQVGFAQVRLGSDHLEYQDLWRRGSFDYARFESEIAAHGRPQHGPLWKMLRATINLPLHLLRCGTYLWGYAVREG